MKASKQKLRTLSFRDSVFHIRWKAYLHYDVDRFILAFFGLIRIIEVNIEMISATPTEYMGEPSAMETRTAALHVEDALLPWTNFSLTYHPLLASSTPPLFFRD